MGDSEGDRERQGSVDSLPPTCTPTRDRTRSSGMFLDQESNPRYFGAQDDTPTHWHAQPGPGTDLNKGEGIASGINKPYFSYMFLLRTHKMVPLCDPTHGSADPRQSAGTAKKNTSSQAYLFGGRLSFPGLEQNPVGKALNICGLHYACWGAGRGGWRGIPSHTVEFSVTFSPR